MRESMAALLLILMSPCAATAGIISEFEGGLEEVGASMDAPGHTAVFNVTVPAECRVLHATLRVSGGEAGSVYPEGLTVSVGGTRIWEFNGTGYGALGRQEVFSDGRAEVELAFGERHDISRTAIRLSAGAEVRSASMELASTGPERLEELSRAWGRSAGDSLGRAVACAGDFNGDGFDDIIAGAPYHDGAGVDSGQAVLLLGGREMDCVPDMVFTGTGAGDMHGYSLSGAGDVNGDGFDDILIGSVYNDSSAYNAGKVCLYLGGASPGALPDLVLTGEGANDFFGSSVSGAGDLNGDGFGDFVIGASGSDAGGSEAGRAYIFYGGPAVDSRADMVLTGFAAYDRFGWGVSGAGDVSGDGYDDVLVSAPYHDGPSGDEGCVYLFLGGPEPDGVADIVFTGQAAQERLGWSASGAGDVNGDGYDDIIVGAPANSYIDTNSGAARIYHGGPVMAARPAVVIAGARAEEYLGYTVAGAGDINDDGYDDVLVGSPYSSPSGTYSGAARVYLGGAVMDAVEDLCLLGSRASDYLGIGLSGAGDINSDGYSDIAIGAGGDDTYGADTGLVRILSRAPFVFEPSVGVAGREVWSGPEMFAGGAVLDDFSAALSACLRSSSFSGSDWWGNTYIDVPLEVRAMGGNLTLRRLCVVYEHDAPVADFGEALESYLAEHRWEAPAGGSVTTPIVISSANGGAATLSNLCIEIDEAPRLVAPVPDLEMDEDTCEPALLDLSRYFRDDYDPPEKLRFDIASSTLQDIVRVSITHSRFLSVDALTGEAGDNWTGELRVRVRCCDRWGFGRESNEFTVTVRGVNDAPLITSSPAPDAVVGREYTYRAQAVDAEGDSLTYGLVRGPEGMALDPLTGILSWVPGAAGSHPVSIRVSDGRAASRQEFVIQVALLNRPPVITSSPPAAAVVGQRFVYEVGAVDIDGDPLEFSLGAHPEGMTIGSSTGLLEWPPSPGQLGDFRVVVHVGDGRGGRARQDFFVSVFPSRRPVVSVARPGPGSTLSGEVTVAGSAVSGDGELVAVELRVDGGDWLRARGLESWSLRLDTRRLSNGPHTLAIRAFDGVEHSELVVVVFSVSNPGADGRMPLAIGALFVLLAAASVSLFLWLGRGRPRW